MNGFWYISMHNFLHACFIIYTYIKIHTLSSQVDIIFKTSFFHYCLYNCIKQSNSAFWEMGWQAISQLNVLQNMGLFFFFPFVSVHTLFLKHERDSCVGQIFNTAVILQLQKLTFALLNVGNLTKSWYTQFLLCRLTQSEVFMWST